MSFDIYELKIVFITNIRKLPEITFKKSMLYRPDSKDEPEGLQEYPYFTDDIKYDDYRLRRMSWNDRLEFFFNKSVFNERLLAYSNDVPILNRAGPKYIVERNENIKHNIELMMEVLFPTKFPVINDLHNSYDLIFGENQFYDSQFFNEVIINPLYEKMFSYLKPSGGQIYTFKKLIWLNDLFNHPLYHKLIEDYRKFEVWYLDEQRLIQTGTTDGLKRSLKVTGDVIQEIIKLLNDLDAQLEKDKYSLKKRELKEDFTSFLKGIASLYGILWTYQNKQGDYAAHLNEIITTHFENKNTLETPIRNIFEKVKPSQPTTIDLGTIGKQLIAVSKTPYIRQKNSTANESPFKKELLQPTRKIINEEPQIKQIGKINELIKKIAGNTSFKREEELEDLKKETYKKNKKYYEDTPGVSIPVEYNKFAYVNMTYYRRPTRESSNPELQSLINSTSEEKVVDFFATFEELYKYMTGKKKETAKEKDYIFSNMKTDTKLKDIMNTGMSFINANQTSGLRREIYIMADFIEGEVNDSNVNSIFCPFVGEHLGNEFEFLARMTQYGQVGDKDANKWSVTRNRMLFSLKNIKPSSNSSNKLLQITAKPLDNTSTTTKNDNFIEPAQMDMKIEKESVEEIVEANEQFLQQIIARNKNSTIKEKIAQLNKFTNQEKQLVENNIVEHLKEKKQTKLYKALIEWSKDINIRSLKLLKELIELESMYKANKAKNDAERQTRAVRDKAELSNEFNKNSAEQDLFYEIAHELSEFEKKKSDQSSGGSRKKRQFGYKRKTFKRKNIKLYK